MSKSNERTKVYEDPFGTDVLIYYLASMCWSNGGWIPIFHNWYHSVANNRGENATGNRKVYIQSIQESEWNSLIVLKPSMTVPSTPICSHIQACIRHGRLLSDCTKDIKLPSHTRLCPQICTAIDLWAWHQWMTMVKLLELLNGLVGVNVDDVSGQLVEEIMWRKRMRLWRGRFASFSTFFRNYSKTFRKCHQTVAYRYLVHLGPQSDLSFLGTFLHTYCSVGRCSTIVK